MGRIKPDAKSTGGLIHISGRSRNERVGVGLISDTEERHKNCESPTMVINPYHGNAGDTVGDPTGQGHTCRRTSHKEIPTRSVVELETGGVERQQ